MKEQLLMKFKLPLINDLSMLNEIIKMGYKKTRQEFSVSFNGSIGNLSTLEISYEGSQTENNRIIIDHLRNRDGSLKSVMVNIFYSQNGIRLSTGIDEPKIIHQNRSGNRKKILLLKIMNRKFRNGFMPAKNCTQ